MKVLTWHVPGNYLYYLAQVPHQFYVVTQPGQQLGAGTGGSGEPAWGNNVHEVAERDLASLQVDCVLYQSRAAYLERTTLLTAEQCRLPSFYLEHDPPQPHASDTRHPAADGGAHIVHVTHFNALMWDNGEAPVSVIEHGVVLPPDVHYNGERAEGVVVVDDIAQDARRLGADVVQQMRRQLPLKLIGRHAQPLDGAARFVAPAPPSYLSRYRFLFNPTRYTSLNLAVVEAMMVGLPVVALATTEMATVIRNSHNGYIDTRLDRLAEVMKMLIADASLARRWGDAARETALQRFNIQRFVADWNRLLRRVTQREATNA